MKKLFKLQLCNALARVEDGYKPLPPNYTYPYAIAANSFTVLNFRYENSPVREHCMHSVKTCLILVGVSQGKYAYTFTFYDRESNHGPFDILVNGKPVISGILTRAGEESRITAVCEAEYDRLDVTLLPQKGADCILNAFELDALDGGGLKDVFPGQPSDFSGGIAALEKADKLAPLDRIRVLADWICDQRQPDGYIGDVWGANENGGGGTPVLYASSFPVRALLAAYALLGEKRHYDAAMRVIDLIVSEQLPNGAFLDHHTGVPTCRLTPEKQMDYITNARKPMSDVGSVIAAILTAAHYADGERRTLYTNSAKAFADGWAVRARMISGAFSDGQGLGDSVYSVATAIQATAHALLYRVSGEEKYLEVAERAIKYLLNDYRPDGSLYNRVPDLTWESTYLARLYPNYAFGHLYYIEEGLITTCMHTHDESLKARIQEALTARALGDKGFMKLVCKEDIWFPLQDTWNNAKQVGTVQTVNYLCHLHPENEALDAFRRRMLDVLCAPALSQRLGVGYPSSRAPKGFWRDGTLVQLSIEASSQAVLALAEKIKPGIMYLAEGKE